VLVATGQSDTRAGLAQPAETHAEPSPRPPPAPDPPATTEPVSRRPAVRPQALSVLITASRGDCWVSAHRGSEQGALLAERTLAEGSTLTLRAPRIWLELGAAGNVDVTVNGRARRISSGTTQIVLQ
jgi:Domain of unknown function (DUF4115)